MGNVCSASFSCDDTISHCLDCIISQAGYICHLKDNLAALRTEFQKLIEARNDVQIRVLVAEQRQMRRRQQVQGWLSRVQDVEKEVPRLLAEIIGKEEEILGGFCSGDCIERQKYGKRVVESLKNVQSLRKEGDFKDVAQTVPENSVDDVENQDYGEPTADSNAKLACHLSCSQMQSGNVEDDMELLHWKNGYAEDSQYLCMQQWRF